MDCFKMFNGVLLRMSNFIEQYWKQVKGNSPKLLYMYYSFTTERS